MLTIENAAAKAASVIASIPPYPGSFRGRGIVTCAGGIKYGTCAWVLVRLLRHLGCRLPIEVWSLNDDEYDPEWVRLLSSYGVRCVNAVHLLSKHPHPRLGGWELKPYAILHSSFQEVLFLDADNVPTRDPTYLFGTHQFQSRGTVFWPDPEKFYTTPDSIRWSVFDTPYRPGPDQESGQLLVDKKRCWRALNLCNWYNEHSDFFYRYVYGDKDTFRFAWYRMGQSVAWPRNYASERLLFTLCQHDFQGRVLFQHRFSRKWSLYGDFTRVPGMEHEELCLGFLDELRGKWRPQNHLMRHVEASDMRSAKKLAGRRFLYERPGHNRWHITLGANHAIEEGFGANEFFWWCEQGQLTFAGIDGQRHCRLTPSGRDSWEGVALNNPRMRLKLVPAAAA